MFRFINFLITFGIIALVCIGGYWFVMTPQPARTDEQIAYAIDTATFKVQQYKLKEQENITTWRDWARAGNRVAGLEQARLLFAQGPSNPNAYIEAATLLRPLADKGIPEAQNALGVLVRDGLGGMQPDKLEAYKWFSLANARGLDLAERNMLELSHQMTSSQIFEAESRASTWLLDYLKKK